MLAGSRLVVVAAEDDAVVLDELVFMVGKIGGDHGATRRAVLAVEVEHDVLLALERRQVDRLHVGVGKLERRCSLSRLQHRERFYSNFFLNLQLAARVNIAEAVVASLHIIDR